MVVHDFHVSRMAVCPREADAVPLLMRMLCWPFRSPLSHTTPCETNRDYLLDNIPISEPQWVVVSVYDPLRDFLASQVGESVNLSFSQVETILGRVLPQSAHDQDWWWANEETDTTRHVQCESWLNAGWRMSTVDRVRERVRLAPDPKSPAHGKK